MSVRSKKLFDDDGFHPFTLEIDFKDEKDAAALYCILNHPRVLDASTIDLDLAESVRKEISSRTKLHLPRAHNAFIDNLKREFHDPT